MQVIVKHNSVATPTTHYWQSDRERLGFVCIPRSLKEVMENGKCGAVPFQSVTFDRTSMSPMYCDRVRELQSSLSENKNDPNIGMRDLHLRKNEICSIQQHGYK